MLWELNLHGNWNFRLDPQNMGIKEAWQDRMLPDEIHIPGILQAQGYGDDINEATPWVSGLHDKLWYLREEYRTNRKRINIPFLCQPPKHYLGKAWYQRSFVIPKNLSGYVFLFRMECVKWRTTVWVDGMLIGSEVSLCTPHEYRFDDLKEGQHTITVCADNSFQYPYRPDGHMVTDAVGASWNGMAGEVSIRAVPRVYIENVRIFPYINRSRVLAEITVHNCFNTAQTITLSIADAIKTTIVENGSSAILLSFDYPDIQLWDEFTQNLYREQVVLDSKAGRDCREISFGFRRIEVKEGLFLVNQRPTYFRGTHFGGEFPLTGYPSTNVSEWKSILSTCKSWGLNFIRFHSYCPPKAAFLAADEEGMYLQVECGMWNDFHEGCEMGEVLWSETERILKEFGNHPSFIMLSPSNEPGGKWLKPLTDWVSRCKAFDSRRLYTAQSGWPYPMEPSEIQGTDYVYFHRSGYGIQPGGTIRNSKGWHGKDYRRSVEGIKYPVISHELGQWCSYPDFDVIEKFRGYLKPGNYRIFRESAERKGVLGRYKDFSYCSGRLKLQLYKEDIEANLRTPHLYGFELLDLHDYIGQGTALVGLLDPFWESRGFATEDEFKEFCSDTVPLLRIPKRVFRKEDSFNYPVEFCHFGNTDWKEAKIYWKVVKQPEGKTSMGGCFPSVLLPIGKNIPIGQLSLPLEKLETPAEYRIEIGILGSPVRNTWSFWLYDSDQGYADTRYTVTEEGFLSRGGEVCKDILYTHSLGDTLRYLREGKKVIFSPPLGLHRLDSPPLQQKTVFWNAQMGPSYGRGMGLVCQKDHPALALFPTKAWQEWQWNEIVEGAYGLNLSELPQELTPIVQPIDDWNRNYRLGMLLECRVGNGSLLIVTADIDQFLEERPAARQLRESLFHYAVSKQFNPATAISEEMLRKSFFPRDIMVRHGVKVKIIKDMEPVENDMEAGKEAYGRVNRSGYSDDINALVDGRPETFYSTELLRYPFTIELQADSRLNIRGITYMPRQNDREHSGDIKGCRVEAFCQDGWRTMFEGELGSSCDPKKIIFKEAVYTDSVRFTGLCGFSGKGISLWEQTREGWHQRITDYADTTAAIAELAFLPADYSDYDKLPEDSMPNLNRRKGQAEERSATKEIDY